MVAMTHIVSYMVCLRVKSCTVIMYKFPVNAASHKPFSASATSLTFGNTMCVKFTLFHNFQCFCGQKFKDQEFYMLKAQGFEHMKMSMKVNICNLQCLLVL